MEKKFLSVKNLTVEYTSGKEIVHAVTDVSFDLERGKTLGLVGETGAGKTSIAKSIMRIIPNPPGYIKSGSIELDGQQLLKISEAEMRKVRGNKISMIFQDPMTALDPLMSVGDQIVEAIELHTSLRVAGATKKAIEMLEMVGIPRARFEEYPHQFSGGMKQRIVIAIALACNPELLLADEPTTALDVTIQAQVLSLMKELQKKLNTSMILITHDLGVIAETCDEVAVIYAGEIVEIASKWDLFMNTKHPYTKGLFNSLPEMAKGKNRLIPIEGIPHDPFKVAEGCAFAPRCKNATDRCFREKPAFVEVEPGHFCRCHKNTEGE